MKKFETGLMFPTMQNSFFKKPVNLDITNRCPLQCPACQRQTGWYNRHRHLFNDMSVEDLQKFIDSGFTYLEFCGQQSDPMAHPNILEFISLCYSIKLDIHTATSHRKKEFYEEAFDRSGMKTKWIFGLDGLPEESHKHRVNQDGVHLYEMMKLGARMGINVIWQYIVFNYNQDHIEQAKKMSVDDGIEFRLSFSDRWAIYTDIPLTQLKPREEYCA
jgi:MoaA/NifB/PqqE/SkfB family radical SAM enzyme